MLTYFSHTTIEHGLIAIALYVCFRDKPLALYIFSRSKKVQQLVMNRTSSGGVCVNDTLMHAGCKLYTCNDCLIFIL